MTSRDYAAEMQSAIDAATSGDEPYLPQRVAEEIVAKLRSSDPDLLSGWLDAQAERFLWTAINRRDQSRRAQAHRRKGGVNFKVAAEQALAGEPAALRTHLDCPYAIEDGTVKRLADMTRADLAFVSGVYEQRASENGMRAAFMAALAKKVRSGVVSDHFTEDQIGAMYGSIVGARTTGTRSVA